MKFLILLFFICLIFTQRNTDCDDDHCLYCDNTGQFCQVCDSGYTLDDNAECYEGLGAGATAGIIIGVVVGVFALAFVILFLVLCCCDNDLPANQTIAYPAMPVVIEPDAYYMPAQTNVTPFISQQLANGYMNNQIGTTDQFMVNPSPSPYTALPHLQPMAPINPSATYLNRDTCSICFSSGTNIRLSPCTHQFHANCIVQWCNRRRVCPNCNQTNFQVHVLCSRCGRFNQLVTLCPVGCQKPNHMDCFMQRNQNKMICTSCIRGPIAVPNSIQPQTIYPPQPIFSQQRMVYQAQPTYQMIPSTSQPIIYR